MARPPRHEPGVRPQTVFTRRLCLGRVCVGQLVAVLTATPAPAGKDPAAFINPTRRWEKDGRGESGCEETGPRTERCPPPGLPSVCSPPGSRVFHTGAAERSRQTRPPLPEGSSAAGSARGGVTAGPSNRSVGAASAPGPESSRRPPSAATLDGPAVSACAPGLSARPSAGDGVTRRPPLRVSFPKPEGP